MATWYKVNRIQMGVEAVNVVYENETQVVIEHKGVLRTETRSEWALYCKTWPEAHAVLVGRAKEVLQWAEERVPECKASLARVEVMRPPEEE
jgi:hypothetical protein